MPASSRSYIRLESVQGKTGSVQLSFNTNVYKYAVFFAICQRKMNMANSRIMW